eukprot:3488759-Prymnesium_polylepis.1
MSNHCLPAPIRNHSVPCAREYFDFSNFMQRVKWPGRYDCESVMKMCLLERAGPARILADEKVFDFAQVRPTEIGFNVPLTEFEGSNSIELKPVALRDALDDDPAVKDDAQKTFERSFLGNSAISAAELFTTASNQLEDVFEWIRSQTERGCVLIYSTTGVNRAAALAIAQ